jgi:tRNA pseudouridine38-40 synthase
MNNKNHWIYKLNNVLPAAIGIQNIEAVKPNAHARFDATERVYYYYLSRQKNPFRDNFTYYVYGELNFELMNKAAEILKEYSDFTSFSKLHTGNKTNICKINEAVWLQSGIYEWRFSIRANRFLRGMVRAIVGTLILVGRKKITLNEFKKIIEAKNRKYAGSNAPANALFLAGIRYPKNIYLE